MTTFQDASHLDAKPSPVDLNPWFKSRCSNCPYIVDYSRTFWKPSSIQVYCPL